MPTICNYSWTEQKLWMTRRTRSNLRHHPYFNVIISSLFFLLNRNTRQWNIKLSTQHRTVLTCDSFNTRKYKPQRHLLTVILNLFFIYNYNHIILTLMIIKRPHFLVVNYFVLLLISATNYSLINHKPKIPFDN